MKTSRRLRGALSRLLQLINMGHEFPSAHEWIAVQIGLTDRESAALSALYDAHTAAECDRRASLLGS